MRKRRLVSIFFVLIGAVWLAGFSLSHKSRIVKTFDDAQQNALLEKGSVFEGERLLKVYGCLSCHQIGTGRAESTAIGPPLTDWQKRKYIAGKMPNNPEMLIRWIRDPQHFEPGTAMPDLGITEEEARDMAAYLFSH